jgi:hypothetical protein
MDVVRAMPPARRKRIANRVVRSTRPAIRDPWSSVWLRMPAWSLGLGVSPLIFEAGAVADDLSQELEAQTLWPAEVRPGLVVRKRKRWPSWCRRVGSAHRDVRSV